ncbi:hypothetical protein LOZ58_006184 [Ophidiomyces ophidiicola]|nr:hypothetical protein LOZ58_006184 [Ophidiomyces ophidiicola]
MARSSTFNICLCLLFLVAVAYGTPVAGTPGTGGNGPLGASPGGPTGPIPVGNGGDSGDSPKAQRNPHQGVHRGVNTSLAVLSAMLMTVTYAVLIGPGTRLSSTSKLPLAAIKANIGNLLSKAWPDTSTSEHIAGSALAKVTEEDAIRLYYVGKLDCDSSDGRTARGVAQCEALPKRRIPTPPVWLTTGSSLTKSMVQLAIWEWVCLWMVLAMVVSTLIFNGFLTGQKLPDAYPRLVVVLIYLTAFFVHAWYVWKSCTSFFTLLGAGAAWSLLNKASFASVDLGQLKACEAGGSAPVFRKVGKPATSSTFPPYENCVLKGGIAPKASDVTKDSLPEEDQGAINTVSGWQKQEISSTVQAGSIALERVITNVVTIVGITITTGFAAWTSIASAGDSTTQLGSLALLASLTIGSGAMFSSAVELSVMDTSFRNVLFYKELMINGQATAHVQKRAKKKNVVGFTHNTVQMGRVGFIELAKFTKLWALLVFGPAYGLLPGEEDHFRQSAGAEFEFFASVRDKKVLLTTEATTKHQVHTDGGSFEAINVCFLPEKEPSPACSSVWEAKQPQVTSKAV